MEHKNTTTLWVVLGIVIVAILVIVGVTTGGDKKVSDKETGPIKIGFISPLSGDGAAYGEPARNAVALWEKKANASGGINGRPIQVIYEDGKCDGKASSLAAQKLISVDKVQVIIGGLCSGETMAAAPIAEQAKVILISPGSSAPAITDAGDYIFRLAPSDVYSAKELAEIISKKGYKKVGVISEQTDYSQGIRKAFLGYMKEKDVMVSYDESFSSDLSDFKSFTSKINESGAEAIFLNPQTGATASRIAKALRDQGNKAQFFVYYMTGDDFVKSGQSVNGTIIVDMGSVSNQELGNAFLSEYKTAYGKEPGYPLFATIGYDTAHIVGQAVSKVGYDASKIKDYLYKMPAYVGITGNLTFDKNGDPEGNNVFVVKEVQTNKLVDYQK